MINANFDTLYFKSKPQMKTIQSRFFSVLLVASSAILTACGGGGTDSTDTLTPSASTTSTITTTTTTTTTTTASCTPAAEASYGYALVFKACNGTVPEYYDASECVKDLSTGLIWEGKPTVGLRAANLTYTNYDDVAQPQFANGGVPTNYRNPSFAEVNAASNSVGYKNAVNASNLCGAANWRMPAKEELLGLVNPSLSPTIDSFWFPNTQPWYWSASPVAGYPQYVGIVYFSNDYATSHTHDIDRSNVAYVRLVRSGP